jgi:hypothetical protein
MRLRPFAALLFAAWVLLFVIPAEEAYPYHVEVVDPFILRIAAWGGCETEQIATSTFNARCGDDDGCTLRLVRRLEVLYVAFHFPASLAIYPDNGRWSLQTLDSSGAPIRRSGSMGDFAAEPMLTVAASSGGVTWDACELFDDYLVVLGSYVQRTYGLRACSDDQGHYISCTLRIED